MSRGQVLAAGISSNSINRRLADGSWTRVFDGVYRIGPVPDPLGWATAALLAAGPQAVLSHGAAAHLRGWLDRAPTGRPDDPIDVIVVGSNRGRRAGIRCHRVQSLEHDEHAVVQGLRVTAPARTLVDATALLPLREVERMVARARRGTAGAVEAGWRSEAAAPARRGAADARWTCPEVAPSHREASPGDDLLRRAVERYGRRRGVRVLRAMLGSDAEPEFTRSEAEERLLSLVRAAGLPHPKVNVRIGRYEVDFHFARHDVVVEVDGYRFHGSRPRFEADRRRDAWLHARGLRVIRLSWRQITEESVRTAVQIGQALARRPERGGDP